MDKVQVSLTRIYEYTYLLTLDGTHGLLHLYKVDYDSPSQLFTTIFLRPGGYALRVVDNLIIIHNYGPQETYIFDIKKDKNPDSCCVMVKHRGSVSPDCKFHQIKYLSEIDPHYVIVSNDFYLDTIDGKLFVLKLFPFLLVEDYPDHLEKILFLLRRNKCLTEALAAIKKCLIEKIEVNKLTSFFNVTNYAYKETAMLRKMKKKDSIEPQKNEKKDSGSKIVDKEVELKSQSGMTVLLQSDMYIHVFLPFYKEIKDYLYLSDVLFAYIYSLVGQDMHVHAKHQYLLVKTLIKLKNFKMLQYLIQYQMLANNLEIALLLTSIDDNKEEMYPELFQLGIDMLHRLKSFGNLAKILAQRGNFFEALGVIATYEDQYDIDHIKNLAAGSDTEEIFFQILDEYKK